MANQWSIGRAFEQAIDWMNRNWSDGFRTISTIVDAIVGGLEDLSLAVPPAVLIAAVAVVAWRNSGWKFSLFTIAGLCFCYFGGLWRETMLTTSLALVAVVLALIIAVPLGILAAHYPWIERMVRPILDLMQTLPPWVYLIPAVILLGVGRAPAVLATVIFGIPPALRLTILGLRQVPVERLELACASGATPGQTLFKIQLPSALPTIMVGVNQCILLSLGMVVLAGLIGAGGLGGEVTRGLSRMMLGLGLRAGLAVVILSMILDGLTQGFVERYERAAGMRASA